MKLKNATKYDFKIYVAATVVILFLLCFLSYLMAPTTDAITLGSFNPVEIIDGTAFALSFGFGVPFVLSCLIIVMILIGLWFCLTWLIREILKRI